MLSYAITTLAFAAVILPLLGYPLAAATFCRASPRRILWSYPLGLAVVLVLARTVVSLAPMQNVAWSVWVAVAVWSALAWQRSVLRIAFINDAARIPLRAVGAVSVLALLCAWASIFPLAHHGTILFEGTPNHDSIYYVANARWLVSHGVGEALVYTPASPLMSMSAFAFGPHAKLGRLGSESLLAFVAVTMGRDPVYLYNALQTLGVAVGCVTALCLLPARLLSELAHTTPRGLLVALAVVLAPQLLQMSVNSNFASLFGTICLTTLSAVAFQARDRWVNPAVFVATAGTVAAYAEEIPIAVGLVGAVFLAGWMLRERTFRASVMDACRFGANIVAAIAFLPWLTLPGLYVLKSAYFEVATDGAAWPDPYESFSGIRYIYAYLTTSGRSASQMPAWLLVAGGVALVAGVAGSRRRRQDNVFAVGVLLGFTVLTALMFVTGYNYGKLKIVEYFALLCTPAIATLAFHDRGSTQSRWRTGISGAAIVSLAAVNITGFAGLCLDSAHWGHHKKITRDFVELARDTSRLAGDRATSVRFTESPFFFSMWYPYFATSPVVFAPDFGSGGYIQTYASTHPFSPFESADIGVSEIDALKQINRPFNPLVRHGKYAAVRMSEMQDISFDGNYALEGNWFWMGPELTVTVRGNGPRQLHLRLHDRFAAIGSKEAIRISLNDVSCTARIPTSSGELIINMPAGLKQTLVIRPQGPVHSPLELGLSNDTRKLTYRISDVSLRPEATGAPTCEFR